MGSRQGCPSFINQTQRLVALSSSALAGWAGSAASVFCQNGEHSPARVPLFGCPVPEVGSQGMSPFLFLGFGGFRIKTHFWSWIDSYLLPTLFCLVFHGAFSWSFSFDPTKSFLTLLGTLQKFLKSPSSRALAGFLKGQHHPPPPLIVSGFSLMETPQLPHLSLSLR